MHPSQRSGAGQHHACRPAGETTKVNGVGAVLTESDITAMEKTLVEHAQQADWVVMAGSLPPGVPENWYSHLVDLLRAQAPNVKIAIDTSDAPLLAVAHDLEKHHADIMTPNSLELGQIVGVSGTSLEAEALAGNYEPVIMPPPSWSNAASPWRSSP